MKNQLLNSSSLYLRQHAVNPVHWQPWTDEALKLAASSGKLVIISIGYAACHWCHVMEHESFSDPEVADLMNKNFISIKIDREERPDLDQQYMAAVHAITGQGGWPLNCIALPDGRPVFGGTYFRRNDWINLLSQISLIWKKDPAKLNVIAGDIAREVQSERHIIEPVVEKTFTPEGLRDIVGKIVSVMDSSNGGLRGAPKFPLPSVTDLLLSAGTLLSLEIAAQLGLLTLERMSMGGIHDHLAGGFARYSVDASWQVPHFEKMLYDNAQLLAVYSKAFILTGNDRFADTARGIYKFLTEKMRSPEGAFYGSIDADSEGEEGLFYTWTLSEINAILGEDASFFASIYGITERGNFENGRNILAEIPVPVSLGAYETASREEELKRKELCRIKLVAARDTRVPPLTDTKQLISWNAMMVSALVVAADALGEKQLLTDAEELMRLILNKGIEADGKLCHLFGKEDARIEAFLDDYASLILALTDLYVATAQHDWLISASAFASSVIRHFSDPAETLFFYTPGNLSFPIARMPEVTDNVVPSSNAMMALALDRLSFYMDEPTFRLRAAKMLNAIRPQMEKHPWSYPFWVLAALEHNGIYPEFSLRGPQAGLWHQELRRQLIPGVRILIPDAQKGDAPGITVCFGNTCYPPTSDLKEVTSILKEQGIQVLRRSTT